MHESELKLLLYRSGDRMFGLPLAAVAEVLPAFQMTGMPGLHDGVVGLVCLRGHILPVIGLDTADGARPITLTAQHRFIVVSSGDKNIVLLAEHIDDIVEAPREPDSRPAYLSENRGSIDRVLMHGEDMVFVLDMERLIADTEFRTAAECLPLDEAHDMHEDVAEPSR